MTLSTGDPDRTRHIRRGPISGKPGSTSKTGETRNERNDSVWNRFSDLNRSVEVASVEREATTRAPWLKRRAEESFEVHTSELDVHSFTLTADELRGF